MKHFLVVNLVCCCCGWFVPAFFDGKRLGEIGDAWALRILIIATLVMAFGGAQ